MSVKESILLIDDDEQVSDVIGLVLESAGYRVRAVHNANRALQAAYDERYSLILLDLRLGDTDGLELFPHLRDAAPNSPILMITAHGDVESAVRAFSMGAAGYIQKPFEEGNLKIQIAQVIENHRLKREIDESGASTGDGSDVRQIILTRDPKMDDLIRRIHTAAQVTSNVVITGESGSGKELVARALHRCGPRRSGPFIAFNCAALPEALIESELFGYMRGAFTDARENKSGLFTRAHGGTLFLDEIGDAPLSIQAKLLRVLQEREITPLGATAPIRVDVRVVAATHKSMQEEVARGKFRQDLYYRLHVLPLHLPPLRERPKDILLLASLFAARIAGELGYEFQGFTHTAEQALEEYPWPGNVRELQNRLEYAIAIGGGGRVSARSIFPERTGPEFPESEEPLVVEVGDVSGADHALPSFHEAKNSFERTYLKQLLSAAQGNIAKAARLASKSRTEVYNLIRKHRIDPSGFKGDGSSN